MSLNEANAISPDRLRASYEPYLSQVVPVTQADLGKERKIVEKGKERNMWLFAF